jgi:hypothetical protein
MTEQEALSATYTWLAIYGFSIALFFGIAVWVIIRGGKDILEMFSEKTEEKNQ